MAGDEFAKPIAGGQSLLPLMNFRLARPDVLVDLALITELDGIELREASIQIGACTLQRTVELSSLVLELCPILPAALAHVGHIQIRNRGTIGGSLAHADPASELCAVALCLGAEMTIQGLSGERVVTAAEFFVGPYTTSIADDELLTAIRFPVTAGMRTHFAEIAMRRGDFALAGIATTLTLDDGRIGSVSLVAFGVGPTPTRLSAAESELLRQVVTPTIITEAVRAARAGVSPIDSLHASAGFKRDLVGTLLERSLTTVSG